jgi:hypothetical protein
MNVKQKMSANTNLKRFSLILFRVPGARWVTEGLKKIYIRE